MPVSVILIGVHDRPDPHVDFVALVVFDRAFEIAAMQAHHLVVQHLRQLGAWHFGSVFVVGDFAHLHHGISKHRLNVALRASAHREDVSVIGLLHDT